MDKTKLVNIPTKLYNVTDQNDYSRDVNTYNHIMADIPYMHILNENTEHRVYTNKIVQEALNEAQYTGDSDTNATAYKHILRDGTASSSIATGNVSNTGVVANIANNGNVTNSSYNKSIVVRNNYTGEISYVNDVTRFRNVANIGKKGKTSNYILYGNIWEGTGTHRYIPLHDGGWLRYYNNGGIQRVIPIEVPDLMFGVCALFPHGWHHYFVRRGEAYSMSTLVGNATITFHEAGNVDCYMPSALYHSGFYEVFGVIL